MEKSNKKSFNRLEKEFCSLHAEGVGVKPNSNWCSRVMADIRALNVREKEWQGTEKLILRFTTFAAAAALILVAAAFQFNAFVYTDMGDLFFGATFNLFDFNALIF